MAKTRTEANALDSTSLGEAAAIGRIQKALFGGDDRLVNLGRYEIRELIGSGAFGKVYRARDPELDRDVAIKVLVKANGADGAAFDDADRDALLREARVMAALGHPNVVAVHDTGVVELSAGRVRVFIAMELVAGGNLRGWLAAPRSPAEILEVMRQAGRGLAAAHTAGIVHRDLKPDNILVGDDGRVRVGDFGLARTHAPDAVASSRSTGGQQIDQPVDRMTLTGAIVGTPAYMAPEQLAGGRATTLSDQFAFCVTLWEALHGTRPFAGQSVDELRAAMAQPLTVPRQGGPLRAGRHVAGALARGLAADPAQRFASIDALLAALEHRRPRWRLPVVLAATACVGLAIGAIARSGGNARDEPAADPCPLATAELAGIWDAARRAEIEHAFGRTALPFAADTFTRVATELDRDADAWLDTHHDACLATTVRHEQSGELLDRRMSCLRDWRRQLAVVTDKFRTASAATVQKAVTTVADLPPLAQCSDHETLLAGPALPADPAQHAKLDQLLDRLANAHGNSAVLDEVARDALATSSPALGIALALARADAASTAGHHDDARAAARNAFDLAVASGDRRSAARAVILIVGLGAFDTRRKDDSLQWARTGKSLVDKLDARTELDARLALAEGNVLVASSDVVPAEAVFARAVADYRTLAIKHEHPGLGAALSRLGTSELGRGKLDEADRHLTEALTRSEAALGATHPDLAPILISCALVQAGYGRYRDAAKLTDRAVEIVRRAFGADHPMLIYALGSRAQHAQMRGDRTAASRDFAEAARIAETAYGPEHPMVAQLALVRADLAAREGHGAEALTLATRGRAIVAKTADDRDLGLAYADAILARALAATGARLPAHARAQAAVARCNAYPTGMPSGPCAIIHQALAAIAHDPAEQHRELTAAIAAITAGTPDPVRLAELHLALSQLTHDRTRAAAALASFPRDGDPALRAALAAASEGRAVQYRN